MKFVLYIRQNLPTNDWRGVVIYPSRNIDTAKIKHYRKFFESQRVSRIYLDELDEEISLPIGIASMKLVIADEDTAIEKAKKIIDRTKQEITTLQQQQLLKLIETILIYKFPNMSREEIETMFSLSELKQTRFYQEAFAEGTQEGIQEGERRASMKAVPRLLALGLSIEQIAEALSLTVEEVRQPAQK